MIIFHSHNFSLTIFCIDSNYSLSKGIRTLCTGRGGATAWYENQTVTTRRIFGEGDMYTVKSLLCHTMYSYQSENLSVCSTSQCTHSRRFFTLALA